MTTYGATYLQLVNKVLARMREASVATVSETTYSTFISTLLNQVKSEIEQAFTWNALRDTYAITVTSGTSSYAFTGAGPDAKVVGKWGWNTSVPCRIYLSTNKEMDDLFFNVLTADIQTGSPTKFLPAGVDANYDVKIDVWPIPDNSTDVMKFNVYVPQADLSSGSDIALIPQNLLLEETIARAMVERGDETAPKPQPGETFILRDLLASEVAREDGHDPAEQDWEVE